MSEQDIPQKSGPARKRLRYGNVRSVEQKGNAIDNDETRLMQAVARNQKKDVMQFIADGDDVNQYSRCGLAPLHVCKAPHLAQALIKAEADPNIRALPNAGDDAGNTPLHEAARRGNHPMIDLLLKKNGNPLSKNDNGRSVVEFCRARVCKMKIEQWIEVGWKSCKSPHKVVVIGAGIAGLAATERITQELGREVEVILLEARDRCGGRIWSKKFESQDCRHNLGANFIHGCDPANAVYSLCKRHNLCGLEPMDMGDEKYFDSKGYPISVKVVDKLKDQYEEVDALILEKARNIRKKRHRDINWETSFQEKLAEVLGPQQFSDEQFGVLQFLKHNQHTYCAEGEKLSTRDLADAYDVGALNGGEQWTSEGFDRIINYLSRLPRVAKTMQLGKRVTNIKYGGIGKNACAIRLDDGTTVKCHSVICTLPLGVLKAGSVHFEPPLPENKQVAISSLGMGLENRIVVQFSKCFWPRNISFFRCIAFPQFKIFNLEKYGKHENMLMFFIPPPFSYEMEKKSDEELQEQVLDCMQITFQLRRRPECVAIDISRWGSDEFARGSYSYIPVHGALQMAKDLRAPVKTLYFAGEATSATDMQMAHGAMQTGRKAALEVIGAIKQDINRPKGKMGKHKSKVEEN